MIPDDFIQTLLHRLDIVSVIERYLSLKRTGANYVACCPFHDEKSPSFSVSPTKQFYHCFGCGAHGTVITFLMEYQGLSFPDAVRTLSAEIGLAVPNASSEHAAHAVEPVEPIYHALLMAAKFYQRSLRDTPEAITYLKKRGIQGSAASRFALGYASDNWQNLAAVFSNYQDPTLEAAGLVLTHAEGKRYDRFRERLIFPIVDLRGRIVGFGGRSIGSGEPKYLNSPETLVFKKGLELYGLYQGRETIRQQQKILVVEGYMDVIALHQAGFTFAVATLGTATTSDQIAKLFRYTQQLVFCFDGDSAGKKAAWRALETALPLLQDGKEVRFLFLPSPEDPDSFLQKFGRNAFEDLLATTLPLSDYLFQELTQRHSLNTSEGAAAFFQTGTKLITQITAPVLSQILQQRLAKQVQLDPLALARLDQTTSYFGAYQAASFSATRSRGAKKAFGQTKADFSGVQLSRTAHVPATRARRFLRLFLYNSKLVGQFNAVSPEGLPEEKAALAWLLDYFKSFPEASLSEVVESTIQTEHRGLIEAVSGEILLWGSSYDAEADFQAEMVKYQEELQRGILRETLANLDLSTPLLREQRDSVHSLLPRRK